MLIAATICLGLLAVATGVGYFIYTWLKVDPIAVASDASDIDRIAAVEGWLNDQFDNCKFNGGVLIIRDGNVLLSKTCGYTDHSATHQLDDHTAFRLASVSKQFTAAGALRLAEMDLLDLDDPVAEHLDNFPFENVNIRHLLNQTSGIPDEYMTLAEEHHEPVGDVLTISKAVDLVMQHSKPDRPPGDAMEYSNTNYVLLAGVIESVSGKSFEKFMSEELFQPLGMNDTRVWNLVSDERSPNQASDFDQIDDDRTPIEPTWLDGVAGDGAVFSSLNDFVSWDRFWYGNSRVSNTLLEQAFDRPKLKDGSRSDYGFGWVVERKRQWHNGAWLGANTYLVRYPKTRSCLVVLDNSSNLRLDSIADEIEEALKPIFTDD
ncbi:serine hydrolase domain-containing protein [Rhodopirellula sp. P2]|uniref:serine hydrolase domain-containing protein n=1 Tax=Rhodopirellula sp. P2 TaxID=2127060 RepID=UPI002368D6E3|nr:serine hydrolase domain-containing protein [Rhodopirellula sp. P2]WDQ15437.1 serine hydrolase [Rhodopirellula sp. P2]